ncbi:hypothetical protein NHP21005_10480 [Helicobacter sp. NHP21005]|nr:hypothetical protein NHP21005_10480 [Helicobacter sp. NHP21005]
MRAELPYKSLRPDITLFVNGLPLACIEVKKPLGQQNIQDEQERFIKRCGDQSNRHFLNLIQLWIFSTNESYGQDNSQGVFYTTSYQANFQRFREEMPIDLASISPTQQQEILEDFEAVNLENTPEFSTNMQVDTPTNALLTSLCHPTRFLFTLRYGIVFLERDNNYTKHIWRYNQLFASLRVQQALKNHYSESKVPKNPLNGVIWHTQGSGKTALSYHLTRLIKDFFKHLPKSKHAKFYFVVDRLDLLVQAKQEFDERGIKVHVPENKNALNVELSSQNAYRSGGDEIVVVNIQRFEDLSKSDLVSPAQNEHLQRVFVVDEAHRSYDPKGCFLANLLNADKNAIKIALTGTPLLEKNKQDKATKKIFGNYLHTYNYAQSIEDGHTLKLIREAIEPQYKIRLQGISKKIQDEIKIDEISIKEKHIFEDARYIKSFLHYIIQDFLKFRKVFDDENLQAMIVCYSSAQAKLANELFKQVQEDIFKEDDNVKDLKRLHHALILHDTKEVEKLIQQFKKPGAERLPIDIVLVDRMLLTGFDAPRLKRLYLAKKLKEHTLLQALARVNRPYTLSNGEKIHNGYIVDLADIQQNFEQTTNDYLGELCEFDAHIQQDGRHFPSLFETMFTDPKRDQAKDFRN